MACASLGLASDYSIFLFGNYSDTSTTLSGRAAAGGDVSFTDQVISSALPVSSTRADLVIGGSVDITRGFNNGNTVISPTSTVINYTMINNNGVTPQPIVDAPIDFASAQTYLQCLSTGWSTLAANGTAENVFGNMQITGTDPVLNIITFNGNDVDGTGLSLEGASQVLLNFPAGSTVLINVLGTDVGFGNYQINVNGASPPDPAVGSAIMWNFPQAATLRNGNGVYTGSVLAPFADMIANGFAQINGQLISGSYDGTAGGITTALVFFTGCLPEVPTCGGVASLSITKLANGATSFTGVPGTSITYNVLVTNTSAVPITNIVITDEALGIQQTVPLLNPGESFPFVADSQVQSGLAGTQYTNTVTAVSDNAPTVSAVVTITIAALPVNVQFTKNASDTTAMPGDLIVYTFTLANMGNTDLVNVRLVDPSINLDLTLPSFFSGTLAQQTFTIPADVSSGSSFTNTAILTADNLPSPGFLESSATLVISSPPSASFRKVANVSSALPGTTILYSYIIQNNSDTALTSLVLSDPMLQLNKTIPFITAFSTIVFEASFTIPPDSAAGTTITNTASLTGEFGTLSSSATVTVEAQLSLLVNKDEDTEFVIPGGTITYTLQVINNGNTSLSNVQISDPLTSFQEVIPILPVGASPFFTTSFTIPLDTPVGTTVTNRVFAQADQIEPVSAFVTAIVTAAPVPPPIAPTVMLGSTVSQEAASPNETVTFTGTVTNNSAVTVRNLVLRSPFFQYSSLLPILNPGATTVLAAEFTIPGGTAPGTVFTATLEAASISIPAQQTAASVVVLPQASLSLSKTLNESEFTRGDTAIFTVVGKNTGNIPIVNLLFSDPALNQRIEIETLSPGTAASTILIKTVTEEPGTTFCNEAIVTSPTIDTVTTNACYTVFGLLLRKHANVSLTTAGSIVNYTVTIRNPMAATASGIVFRDPIPSHSELVADSVRLNGNTISDGLLASGIRIPPLGPDATAIISFSLTVVSEPADGFLVNTAEATFRFLLASGELSGTSFSNTVSVAVEEHEE